MPDDFAAMFKSGIPRCGITCPGPTCGTILIRPDQAGRDDPVPKMCPVCGITLEYYTAPDDFGMCNWWHVRAAEERSNDNPRTNPTP